MFKNLSIRTKLVFAFLTTSLVPAAVGWVAYHYSTGVIESYQSVVKLNVPNLEQFVALNREQVQMVIPVAALVGSNSTPEDAERAKKDIQKVLADFEATSKLYEAIPFAAGEEEYWREFLDKSWAPFVAMSLEMVRLSGTNNREDQALRDRLWSNEYKKMRSDRIASFEKVMKFQIDNTEHKSQVGDEKNAAMNRMIVLTIAMGFLICMAFGFVIANYLTKQIQSIIDALKKDTMAVSAASTQLASTAQGLSQAATEQAASLQETAASVEELSSMVTKNTENSRRSTDSSSESKRKAEDGRKAVDRMISSMEEIHTSNQAIADQVNSSNEQLSEIISVIREIGEKTKVINDIVFQTKLLSFNASVEAARAGEQGKGFAVVAEEVGNLAVMSGKAAKEITDLLSGSTDKVNRIVNQSRTQVETLVSSGRVKVDAGVEVARHCADVLGQIVNNVSEVAVMAEEISAASDEQAHGIQEINRAMGQLDSVTHQNATSTDQASQAAGTLSAQAESLSETVKKLSSIIYGARMEAQSVKMPERTGGAKVIPFEARLGAGVVEAPPRGATGFGEG